MKTSARFLKKKLDKAVEVLDDFSFWLISNESAFYFAIFEEDKRWDTADTILLRKVRGLVNVNFYNCSLTIHLCGNFIENGREGLTRSTPFRPEVHENRFI